MTRTLTLTQILALTLITSGKLEYEDMMFEERDKNEDREVHKNVIRTELEKVHFFCYMAMVKLNPS